MTFPTRALLLMPLLLIAAETMANPAALPDQYGNQIDISSFQSAPLLAIVAGGRKLRHIKGWEEGLRSDFPKLQSVRIADITEEPRPTYDQVATKLRKRVPDGVSIMIDLNNVWANEYELDTRQPCLLLFDVDGTLVARFRGRAKKDSLAEVSAALEQLLQEPVTDNP